MIFLKADLLYKIFLLSVKSDVTKIVDHLYEMFFVMVNNGTEGALFFNSMPVINYEIIDYICNNNNNIY
jgi:hypothetical protein